MTIIASIPNILTNGTTADATQVMADFNSIISQVNANGAALAGGNAFTGTQTIGGDTILTANAQIIGGNGSVAAPHFSFFASQSTGVWSPAANTLGLAANGVNAIYIDPLCNVVVSGTMSPLAATNRGLLTVNGVSSAILGLSVGGANAGYIAGTSTNTELGAVGFLDFVTNNSEQARFDVNGNFLVGTTAASFGAAGRKVIEINGSSTALIGLKVNGVSAGYFYHDGTNAHVQNILSGSLVLETVNTTRLTIDSIGRTQISGAAATLPLELGNTGGAVAIDTSKSNVVAITLTSNLTSLTLTNLTSGQTINLFITQDGTGSRTLNGLTNTNGYVWPSGVQGVLSTPAGSVDLLVMTYRAAVGKIYCTLAKAFS